MQIQSQVNQNNKKKKIKKSHLLIIGSFLVFVGMIVLSYNHLLFIKNQLFSDMFIAMSNKDNDSEENMNVPIVDNISGNNNTVYEEKNIDYSKYLGVISIPKIGLKRGFYNINSKYNNIEYNVTLVKGSTMPDVDRGNLILMAHSGDAYISYFAYLYLLKVGDKAIITYNGREYKYSVVNIYDVDKTGQVTINRNYDKTTLTLITCTKNDDFHQTVYILELVS